MFLCTFLKICHEKNATFIVKKKKNSEYATQRISGITENHLSQQFTGLYEDMYGNSFYKTQQKNTIMANMDLGYNMLKADILFHFLTQTTV